MYFYISKSKLNEEELEILGSTPIPINPATFGREVLVYEGEHEPTLEEVMELRGQKPKKTKKKIETPKEDTIEQSVHTEEENKQEINLEVNIYNTPSSSEATPLPISPILEEHKPSKLINPLKRVVFKGKV